jgi:hypothetical protein
VSSWHPEHSDIVSASPQACQCALLPMCPECSEPGAWLQMQQWQIPADSRPGLEEACLEEQCRRRRLRRRRSICGPAAPHRRRHGFPLRLEAGGAGDHAAESPLQRLVHLRARQGATLTCLCHALTGGSGLNHDRVWLRVQQQSWCRHSSLCWTHCKQFEQLSCTSNHKTT